MMPSEVPSQQHLWLLGVTGQCPGQQVGVGAEPSSSVCTHCTLLLPVGLAPLLHHDGGT